MLVFDDQGIARCDGLIKSPQRHPEQVAAPAEKAIERPRQGLLSSELIPKPRKAQEVAILTGHIRSLSNPVSCKLEMD